MILDAVVRPVVTKEIPTWQFLGDQRPLIAYLLMHFVQNLRLLRAPLSAYDSRVKVIVIPR